MGRPRKRQFIETETASASNDINHVPEPEPAQPYFIDDLDLYNGLDNFLDPSFSSSPCHASTNSTQTSDGRRIMHFGDREIVGGPPIDFGNIEAQGGSIEDTGVPLQFPELDLSTASNPSLTDSENSPPAAALVPCGCLSAM